MARQSPRSHSHPASQRGAGAKPGSRSSLRDTPQTRAAARRVERISRLTRYQPDDDVVAPAADAPVTTETLTEDEVLTATQRKTNSRVTRTWILIVIVALIVWSFGSSIKVYVEQQRAMTAARVEIAERQERINQLKDEIERWNNPDYVRTQARTRLGWVVPGETGYRVIGRDGTVIGESIEIDSTTTLPTQEANEDWSDRLLASLHVADQPPSEDNPNDVYLGRVGPAPGPTAKAKTKKSGR